MLLESKLRLISDTCLLATHNAFSAASEMRWRKRQRKKRKLSKVWDQRLAETRTLILHSLQNWASLYNSTSSMMRHLNRRHPVRASPRDKADTNLFTELTAIANRDKRVVKRTVMVTGCG